jgi:cation/acetate symporter
MVGPDKILAAPGKENSAAPLLAFELGGTIFLGIISAVAFATILAVVAGLAITASASFAHDIYASVIKRGKASEEEQVRVSRITVVVIGIVAIVLGILAMGQNIAFLVALAFAVAASANLPSILYSLFWSRFTARGALWSIYGGLISSVGLIIFSPVVSGQASSVGGIAASLISDPHIDFAFFPLDNPGIVSIPLAFFLGWLGSVTDRRPADPARFARMQVRALVGVGAERGRHG